MINMFTIALHCPHLSQSAAKALESAKNKPKKEKAAKAKAKVAAEKWVILRAELFGPAFVLSSKNPETD